MEDKKQKIRKAIKRWAKIIVALLIISAIAWLIWWWLGQISDKTAKYLNPPPIKAPLSVKYMPHAEFKYWFRNGSYLPQRDSKSVDINNAKYSLELKLDRDYISPIYGSKITGSIQILENGHKIDQLPASLIQRYGDDLGKLRLYLTEFGIVTPRLNSPLIHQTNYSDYQTPTSGIYDMPIYAYFKQPDYLLKNGSFIYAEDAQFQYNPQNIVTENYIALSKPQTDFELYYIGGRISPYVEITAGIGKNQKDLDAYTAEYLYFADQKTNDWQDLDISETNKGEFYYDVKLEGTHFTFDPSTDSIERATRTFQLIKMTVTSRDSNTDEINTDPIQRVKIWSYLDLAGVVSTANEQWRSESGDTIEFFDKSFWTDRVASLLGSGAGVELDLIDGQVEIYFEPPDLDLPWSNLAFVVQPANYFQLESCKTSFQTFGVNNCFRNKKISIAIPPEFEEQSRSKLFLYGQWHNEDDWAKQIYTIATISSNEMPYKSFKYRVSIPNDNSQ